MTKSKFSMGIALTGLADEAGDDIETQIRAHLELGWSSIELRMIGGRMLSVDLPEAEFDRALAQIEAVDFKVEAVSSAIGNWSRSIDGDFALDLRELELAARRMRRLGTRFLRTMSWKPGAASVAAWRNEASRRYRILARMAEDTGIVLLHENCAGWGGLSAAHMCELADAVDSPAFGLLFDIGNTISHGYDPWSFYQGLKGRIAYVHIKDCRRNPEGGRSADYALPGAGDAMVRGILADLMASGYRGTFSIEPHIAAVIHTAGKQDPARRYAAYIDYARRVETILIEAANRAYEAKT